VQYSSAKQRSVVTPTNVEQNISTDQRLFATTTTTTTTTTTSFSDELDVQVPCSDDRASIVIDRQSVRDESAADDDPLAASSGRPLWNSVDGVTPRTETRSDRLNTTNNHDDATSSNLCGASLIVDDDAGTAAESKAATDATRNSAYAHCTAVVRFLPGEHDDARRSAVPPDVAANTDELATAAVDASADDRNPYAAVARAAAQAASAAVGDAIWKVREVTNGAARDAVELELSARCVVRYSSSSRHRSAQLLIICSPAKQMF